MFLFTYIYVCIVWKLKIFFFIHYFYKGPIYYLIHIHFAFIKKLMFLILLKIN